MELHDSEIMKYTHYNGIPHPEYGLDYFVYTKSQMKAAIPNFPPFIAGAWRWDNWLLGEYLRRKIAPTVDLSNTVTAVHQQSWVGNKPHEMRAGAVFNDELVKNISGYLYRIGFMSRTDYWTEDKGQFVIKQKPQSDLLVTLFRRAYPKQRLLLLSVKKSQLDLARNFICWANTSKFENYLILSEDEHSRATLTGLGIETYSIGSVDNIYSDVVLNYTHTVLYSLKQGFYVKLAELGTSWNTKFFKDDSALVRLPIGGILSFSSVSEESVKEVLRCQARKYGTDDASKSVLSNVLFLSMTFLTLQLRACISESNYLSTKDMQEYSNLLDSSNSNDVLSALQRMGSWYLPTNSDNKI
jgi:hypothetical protein